MHIGDSLYILMKRDTSAKLFFLCQISGRIFDCLFHYDKKYPCHLCLDVHMYLHDHLATMRALPTVNPAWIISKPISLCNYLAPFNSLVLGFCLNYILFFQTLSCGVVSKFKSKLRIDPLLTLRGKPPLLLTVVLLPAVQF